jgi:hypothetical protein
VSDRRERAERVTVNERSECLYLGGLDVNEVETRFWRVGPRRKRPGSIRRRDPEGNDPGEIVPSRRNSYNFWVVSGWHSLAKKFI